MAKPSRESIEQSITDLQDQLRKFGLSDSASKFNETTFDTANVGADIFLPVEDCPSGLEPCNAALMAQLGGSCPPEEEGTHPPMYNVKGERCYSNQAMERAYTVLKKDDKLTMINNIRALVKLAARLNGELAGTKYTCPMVDETDGPVPGTVADDPKTGKPDPMDPVLRNRRAFCGMMLDDQANSACKWDEANSKCTDKKDTLAKRLLRLPGLIDAFVLILGSQNGAGFDGNEVKLGGVNDAPDLVKAFNALSKEKKEKKVTDGLTKYVESLTRGRVSRDTDMYVRLEKMSKKRQFISTVGGLGVSGVDKDMFFNDVKRFNNAGSAQF